MGSEAHGEGLLTVQIFRTSRPEDTEVTARANRGCTRKIWLKKSLWHSDPLVATFGVALLGDIPPGAGRTLCLRARVLAF